MLFALHNIVDDEENVTALALDAAEYYEKSHDDTAYLEALEAKRREVEKSLANLVKVIEKGVVSDTVTQRLTQLEEQKSALNDAIGTENVRVSLCEDRHSIQAYFDKFLHADVNDPEIRDQVFEYFVDKVYLYDDKLVVSVWFSEDDKQEITWRDWFSLDEYWTDESPFVKGEAAEFDCFPLGSTEQNAPPSGRGVSCFFEPIPAGEDPRHRQLSGHDRLGAQAPPRLRFRCAGRRVARRARHRFRCSLLQRLPAMGAES